MIWSIVGKKNQQYKSDHNFSEEKKIYEDKILWIFKQQQKIPHNK
jgi:hypothetical protein